MGYLEKVYRNTALVSSTKPLRVQSPGRIVLLDVDSLVQGVDLVFFAPVLGVFQLTKSLFGNKLARSQVAEKCFVVMAWRRGVCRRGVVFLRLTYILEAL